jgi:hypothetical protein
MKINTLIAFAFFGVLMACGPNEEDVKLEALYNELIDGHDVVMPLSMKLPKIKTEVLAFVADLPAEDSLKLQALDISSALTKTNDDMYTWMDALAVAMNDVEDKKEKIALYEKLNKEIREIDIATKNTMDVANKFLGKNE